jgi:DNA polymerase-3 subunit delta
LSGSWCRSRAGVIFELSNALARAIWASPSNWCGGYWIRAKVRSASYWSRFCQQSVLLAKDLMEHIACASHSPFQFISAINRCPLNDRPFPRKDGSINAYALGIAAQHAHRFEIKQLIKECRRVSGESSARHRSSITS